MQIFSGSKRISLSFHPVEVMLLRNLNSARHHNQWRHCNYMYHPKPTRVSASLARWSMHINFTTDTKVNNINIKNEWRIKIRNRVLAYFSHIFQLFINRAMTCTCDHDLWPVTYVYPGYLTNFMFDLNLYQISWIHLIDDLSHKLNPLITITNITCLWDYYFLRKNLKFKLKLT